MILLRRRPGAGRPGFDATHARRLAASFPRSTTSGERRLAVASRPWTAPPPGDDGRWPGRPLEPDPLSRPRVRRSMWEPVYPTGWRPRLTCSDPPEPPARRAFGSSPAPRVGTGWGMDWATACLIGPRRAGDASCWRFATFVSVRSANPGGPGWRRRTLLGRDPAADGAPPVRQDPRAEGRLRRQPGGCGCRAGRPATDVSDEGPSTW